MFNDPRAPNRYPPAPPFHQEVYRVALPVRIASTDTRVDGLDSFEQQHL